MTGGKRSKALAALLLPVALCAGGESFDAAYKVYQVWVKRPSLLKRTKARERLAETGDSRALQALIRDYAKPEEPKDQVKYLCAYIAGENFGEQKDVALFDEWRTKQDHADDAWLWYLALRNRTTIEGPKEAMDVARSDKNIFLRAAGLEALRFVQDADLLPFIAEMEKRVPSEGGMVRTVLLESLTALLCSRVEQVKKPEFVAVAQAVIKRMDEPATMDRTRIVMGRLFAKLYRTGFVWRNGERWLQEVQIAAAGGQQQKRDERYGSPPTFAGIEASGDRICYVIDLSDSMLEPLSPPELKKLPRGPTTGTPSAQAKISKNDRWKQAFENVKWDKVTNKFEAAREMLKTSLLMLEENQYFCVICFGDGAGPIKGTKGLQKATLEGIQSVIKILDGIKAGPKKELRPYGTLLGYTNLHGGLHRAYKLKSGAMVGPGEYVNWSTFDDGCDTIFLLSDGAPTCDDWPSGDSKDPEDHAGDPETGALTADSPNLIFQGPYRNGTLVIGDVTRLNLFRKAEIHCVGMGDAQMSILQALSGIGRGQSLDLTAPGKK